MRYSRWIAAALLLTQAFLLARMMRVYSPLLDELPHLASGIAHWEFGTFELYRVNPPLVRMLAALPVMAAGVETDWMGGWPDDPLGRPEFPLGRRLGAANGERIFMLTSLARWACLPFSLLGGWICFRWARELYGDCAGLTALALWTFCPNVLAWGATICPDLPAASVGLAAAYTFWRWLKAPAAGSLGLAGLALGLALLTKSTWVILLPLWPALWFLWRLAGRRPASGDPAGGNDAADPSRPSAVGVVLLAVMAIYVVNVGYGFSGALRPLGEFDFVSRTMTGLEETGVVGNRFRGTWLSRAPSPLPADYLRGIDVQRHDFEEGKWSYLRGEQKRGGWWWYYLYGLSVKTPVGTLALLALSLLTCWLRRGRATWRDEAVLLAPGLAVLVLVSSQTGFNRYLRYVLPALPGLFIWCSRFVAGGSLAASRLSWGRITRLGLTAGCLLASIVSSLRVWPHSVAYFNEIVDGPEEGHRHLLDANIDWGQGLLTVRDWLHEHAGDEVVYLTSFGWVDPELAGVDCRPVPRLLFDDVGRVLEGDPSELQPGWYVASVNHVMGYRHYDSDRPVYTWLQEFEPVARPGIGDCVFHLTEKDIRYLRRNAAAPDSP